MKKTFFIRTYGCQMNFSEAERLRQLLKMSGWKEAENPELATALIAIGCSVRQKAENRVISFLKSYKNLKKNGTIFCLAGCTANLHREKILKQLPHLDVVCGPNHIAKIPEILNNYTAGKIVVATGENDLPFIECIVSGNNISMMVPITKGCNNFCSYCVVPFARGRLQSRQPESIIEEIKTGVEKGVRAVTLLGQNVNEYGQDFLQNYDFSDLLCEILRIDGLLRIEFISSHPEDTSTKLLKIMSENQKIARHLHIPLQSGSNRILKAMNRKYTVEKFLQVVETAREMIPDISITSDIMVGFPGETEKDFNQTYNLVKKLRFNELFIFKYSPRPMTKAYNLPDTVEKEEKQRRHRLLLEMQKQISNEILSTFTGKKCDILVERRSLKDSSLWIGRTIQGIPAGFKAHKDLTGKIVKVKILSHAEGILYGKEDEESLSQQD
ncbi:MAG: tRNA (N6-isopentenyl adenosine(37)-C2)-methylthiotransferase MiaB [Candidatus Omnitrophica bacterium]|nr:tRNA (N6-isopentenyl adenosine(37)-C2)-methylthiotransferase MiaB [Candidatus Omnitrophota bacterium]MCM8824538.1 tRNA (N6-isopentenyl adenosine(37)-C2)-methylthiotransferase MiaB [Candidatus Omnitrophota bacterium]